MAIFTGVTWKLGMFLIIEVNHKSMNQMITFVQPSFIFLISLKHYAVTIHIFVQNRHCTGFIAGRLHSG